MNKHPFGITGIMILLLSVTTTLVVVTGIIALIWALTKYYIL